MSHAVEHADMKSDVAALPRLGDGALEHAIRESKKERARIQALAEAG